MFEMFTPNGWTNPRYIEEWYAKNFTRRSLEEEDALRRQKLMEIPKIVEYYSKPPIDQGALTKEEYEAVPTMYDLPSTDWSSLLAPSHKPASKEVSPEIKVSDIKTTSEVSKPSKSATRDQYTRPGLGDALLKFTQNRKYSSPYADIIEEAGKTHSVPPLLLHAVLTHESGGKTRAVSKKGAKGLMQFMPDTFTGLGYSLDKIYDPRTNIFASAQYFNELGSDAAPVAEVLARYNAGRRNVDAAKARAAKKGGDWKEYLPRETKGYLKAIGSNLPPGAMDLTLPQLLDIRG